MLILVQISPLILSSLLPCEFMLFHRRLVSLFNLFNFRIRYFCCFILFGLRYDSCLRPLWTFVFKSSQWNFPSLIVALNLRLIFIYIFFLKLLDLFRLLKSSLFHRCTSPPSLCTFYTCIFINDVICSLKRVLIARLHHHANLIGKFVFLFFKRKLLISHGFEIKFVL